MQQMAQKLYKKHNDNTKFLFWIVGSTLLQPETPPAMITVSEKMLAKVYHTMDTSKGPGAEELELYVTTLVLQKKFQEAMSEVALISSRKKSITAALEDDDHFREHTDKVQQMPQQLYFLTLDLLFLIGDIPALCSKAEELIVQLLPDQWNAWELLTHITLASIPGANITTFLHATAATKESFTGLPCFSVFRTEKGEVLPSFISPNSRAIADHLRFIQQIQMAHPKLRGPRLAKLRFVSEFIIHVSQELKTKKNLSIVLSSFLTTCGAVEAYSQVLPSLLCETVIAEYGEVLGTAALYLLALILQYIQQFHSKYCCFSDLKPTLYALRNCEFGRVVYTGLAQLLQVQMMELYHELMTTPLPLTTAVNTVGKEVITTVIDLTKDDFEQEVVSAGAVTAINEGILEGMVEGVINNLNLTSTAVADEENDEDDNDNNNDNDDEEEAQVTTANAKKNKKKKNNKKSNKKGNKKHTNKSKHQTTNKSDEADITTDSKVDELPPEPKATHQVNVTELKAVIGTDEALLLKLCSFSQFLEVTTCCQFLYNNSTSSEHVVGSNLNVIELIMFFTHISQVFANGVGGELRTIRPADSVLLTITSIIRKQLQTRFFTPLQKADFITSYQYVALLMFALEKSPFSYAIKVDLMEGLRAICSATEAYKIYENFGVKYVQHDTLSYLIIPCLMENGLLKEAASRHRQIVHTHNSSRREAGDMLTHSFEFGNYIKALQINEFIMDSRNSLSLSLANVEGRVLDMIYNPLTDLNDFHEFFALIDKDNHDDIFQAFADVHVEKLVLHWEYELLERIETLPVHMAQSAQVQREQALQLRLLQPTFMMQFTHKLMKNDLNFATHIAYPSHVTDKKGGQEGEGGDDGQYERFMQSVDGDEPFAMVQGELMTQMAGLAIQFLFRCNQEAGKEGEGSSTVGSITSLHNSFSHVFNALDEYARLLLLSSTEEEVRYTEELIFPQPQVIRRIWAFTRGPSMWVSCLLLILIQRSQKDISLMKYLPLLKSLADELGDVTTAPEEVKMEDVQDILSSFTSESTASTAAASAEANEAADQVSGRSKEEEMVKLLLAVVRRWAVLMGN